MSRRYASSTEVPPESSRMEIERTVTRYGATGFMAGWRDQQAVVAFEAKGRQVRLLLPLPDPADKAFQYTPETKKLRSDLSVRAAYEQTVRQRWRALALVIKAKLEAVEAGIVTFEDEFAMHMVLPDGTTVREHVRPRIEAAYRDGSVQPLLPDYTR